MSHLVRFADEAGTIRVGVLAGEQLRPLAVASMSALLRHPVHVQERLVRAPHGDRVLAAAIAVV